MYVIFLIFLIFYKFVLSDLENGVLTQFSDKICQPGSIRIEVASSSTNGYNVFGYYMWRDSINADGGICTNGDLNEAAKNNCVGGVRRPVCLQIYEMGSVTTTSEEYKAMLINWIDDIKSRSNSNKPHFIILPMGDEFHTYINNYIYNKHGMFGLEVMVVGSCAPDDAYTSTSHFTFTPIMKSKESALPAIELFHKRLDYTRWMILGDTVDISFSINSIQAIVDEYRSQTGVLINLLEKRCEGERSNIDGKNCQSVSDCPSEEACLYPLVNTSQIFINDKVNEIKKWMELAQKLDPDVLILNVDNNFISYIQELKIIGYTPKVIMSFTRAYTVVEPRKYDLDNTYFYYASAFSENQGYGNDNMKAYMGSTDNYINYIKQNYKNYINTSIYDVNIDLDGDYEYIARGSLIGITIQRLVEISSTLRSLPFGNDELYFHSSPVSNMHTVIQKYFSVCESDDNSGIFTQPCSYATCSKGCSNWNTFFGSIGFDINGMNDQLKSTLVQIQSYEDYKTPYIVSPSTSPACNKDKHVCTEENGYKDCTCKYITPSPWSWRPKEKSSYYTNAGEMAAFYIFSVIYLIIILCLYIFTYKNERKLKMLKIPMSFKLWFFFPLILAIYQFMIIGRPTTASCSLESFMFVLAVGPFSFIPYFVNKELSENLHSTDMKKEMISVISYYILLAICVVINPVKQKYNTELASESVIYYYSCDNYFTAKMYSYFQWFLVVEQLYFYLFGSYKRNAIIVYLQTYYLILAILYGIILVVNNILLPYTKPVIVFIYILVLIFGLFFIIPFPYLVMKKPTQNILKECIIGTKKYKRKQLHKFLKNRVLRTHMICFGEILQMNSYIEFYYAIVKYERIKIKDELESKAYDILTKFINNDYVPLPLELKANIMNRFSALTVDLFREAKAYTFDIIFEQFWDKFLSSTHYEMSHEDDISFIYMLTRADQIRRAIEVSLGVSVMCAKLSQDEKDEIISVQKPQSSVYRFSRNSKLSKANSRKSGKSVKSISSKINITSPKSTAIP